MKNQQAEQDLLLHKPQNYYELLNWQKDLSKAFGEDQAEDLVDAYLQANPDLSIAE